VELLQNAGHLTDAQARNLVIKALRQARAKYRTADTQGEKLEREFDRLIKRQTRINAASFTTLVKRYTEYTQLVEAIQTSIITAHEAASYF
jgi:hypothetical protein